jgi:hypothetical protein
MVYAAILAVDLVLVIVIGVFILGARAREEAHRHH